LEKNKTTSTKYFIQDATKIPNTCIIHFTVYECVTIDVLCQYTLFYCALVNSMYSADLLSNAHAEHK